MAALQLLLLWQLSEVLQVTVKHPQLARDSWFTILVGQLCNAVQIPTSNLAALCDLIPLPTADAVAAVVAAVVATACSHVRQPRCLKVCACSHQTR